MADNALNQWIEEEAALKARLARAAGEDRKATYVTPDLVSEHTGLEIMQGIADGLFIGPSIGETLDFLLMSVADGEAIFQGTPGPKVLNPMGGVHGGWYATLLDSAMACAVHTKVPKGRLYTTAELSVNLVRGIGKNAQTACHWAGHPLWTTNGNGRGQARRPRRHTLCAWHDHLFNFRSQIERENDTMRLLHTMLRVGDLDRSIQFYTDVLGMKLIRKSENTEYKYTLAFVGYGQNPDHAELELTYNWGQTSYDMGTAYGHIALAVPDAYAACDKIRAAGGNVTREAGPVKGGNTVIAFVTDPDGYKIELIQRPEAV